MNTYVQAGVSGVMIGGLYAVMALGLSLTWGLLRIINLAHFALILLGAYVTYELTTSTGADPLLAALVLVPSMFVLGVAIQWVIERFQVDEFNSLLLSFGLFIIAIRLISNIWSADFRQIRRTRTRTRRGRCSSRDIAFPVPQLMALGAALVFAVASFFVLRRTYFGRALRALAYDREMAAAFGVNPRRIGMLAAGLASAMAGVAGVLIGVNQAVFPQLAFEWVGPHLRRGHPRRDRQPARGGRGGHPDRPRGRASSASRGRPRERRSSSSFCSSSLCCSARTGSSAGLARHEGRAARGGAGGRRGRSPSCRTSRTRRASRRTTSSTATSSSSGSPRRRAGTSSRATPATSASGRARSTVWASTPRPTSSPARASTTS